jgi:mono/diheme cytochrome c family protein
MSQRARRGLIFIGLILLPFIIGLLITYQIITVVFPTDMQFQPSVDYQEGPRLQPPPGAVSITGQTLAIDTVPSNPVPTDEISLQRGEILYSLHCELCHGNDGKGDGPLEGFYEDRSPSDLTASNITAQFDGSLFRTLSQGLGQMPGMQENLTSRERWDVINYVRSLEN